MSMLLWKLLINAGLALGCGAWGAYLFEPDTPVERRIVWLTPAVLFGAVWLYDVVRKRRGLLPPLIARLVRFEQRSLHDILAKLSSRERRELSRRFSAGTESADTMISIQRKRRRPPGSHLVAVAAFFWGQ